ncbi:hypothetical protein K2X33_15010, partial [bacterium]|nr:hypothetical protein [bacterium]
MFRVFSLRSIRKASRAVQALTHQSVTALLILSLTAPQLAFAADGTGTTEATRSTGAPAGTPEATSIETRLVDGLRNAKDATANLALTDAERNIGFLTSWYMVDEATDTLAEHLGEVDVSATYPAVAQGEPIHGLQVSTGMRQGLHTLRLSLKGYGKVSELQLPRGMAVVSTDFNDELLYILMNDGSLHAIDVKNLE